MTYLQGECPDLARGFYVGGVLVVNNPPAGLGAGSSSSSSRIRSCAASSDSDSLSSIGCFPGPPRSSLSPS